MAMMRPHRRPVQLFLPLLPAVVALLLLAVVLWAAERIVGQDLARRAEFRVELSAQRYADQLSRALGQRFAELQLLAAMTQLDPRPAVWRQQMQQLKAGAPSYVWIGVIDVNGRVIAGTDGLLEGRDIATRPVFVQGRQGPFFGSLHAPVALRPEMLKLALSPPTEVADLALPLHDSAGRLSGVLAAHLDGHYFERLRQQALGPAAARRSLDLTLTTADGQPVLGLRPPVPVADWQALFGRPAGDVLQTGATAGDAGPLLLARAQTEAMDSPLRPDWQVVAMQPLAAALQPVARLQRSLLLWGLLAALLIGAAGFWISRRLARPYSEMLDALALQIDAAGAGSPGAPVAPGLALQRVAEQLRRLPPPSAGAAPAERLLDHLLRDAERLQRVLAQLPAPLYLLDTGLRIVYWNPACEQVFGWSAEQALGRPASELLRPALDADALAALRQQLVSQPGPWQLEAQVLHRDGSDLWGQWQVSRVLDAEGQAMGLVVQVRDLTAMRTAAQQLREQAEVLQAVVNAASDAIVSVDLQGRVTLFNPAAERIFGHRAQAMLGRPLDELLPPAARSAHGGWMQGFAAQAGTGAGSRRMGQGRVQGLRADGAVLELEASISAIRAGGQQQLTAMLRDITERVRAEQALAQYQVELSDLTQRLLDQERQTSQRLAQALHDQLGQTLAAIRLRHDALCAPLRASWSEALQARAQALDGLIAQAVQQVREVLAELRPPMLQEAGLLAALDNELRLRADDAEPAQLELQAEAALQHQRWPPEVEYAAFMIAREALVNAVLHARARHILVRLQGGADRLELGLADDGIGLDEAAAQGRPGHLGIVGMRERAQAIGARLQFKARPSGGTLVSLSWQPTRPSPSTQVPQRSPT